MSAGTCHHGNPANGTCRLCKDEYIDATLYGKFPSPCPTCAAMKVRLDAAEKVVAPARKLEESLRRCDRDGVPIINAMALMELRAALAAYEKEGK